MAATVQPSSQPLAAPPGLEGIDMTPAKVELQGLQSTPAWPPQDYMQPCYAPVQTSTPSSVGDWVNAVMAVAPRLDQQGLRKALSIVDGAISNAQQAKALDQMLSSGAAPKVAHQFGAGPNVWHAAEYYRMQLAEQQQCLLRQLQHLCLQEHSEPQQEVPATVEESGMQASSVATTGLRVAAKAAPGASRGGRQKGSDARREQTREARGKPRSEPHAEPPVSAEIDVASVDDDQKLSARQVQTLSTSLQILSNEDPDCLFIVRRINKLGFKAARTLKRHFTAYGSVVRVLAAHSTVRQHGDPQCHARRRPSSLGFVQMANADAVCKILALGDEQDIDGALIRVQRFRRQHGVLLEEGEEDTNDRQAQGSEQSEEELTSQRCSMTPASDSTAASFSDVHSQAVESVGDSDEQ